MIEHLSQSMIGMWFRCPEQVRRRYIEGEIIPPGIAARIGTGLHKGAEVNHRSKMQTGEDEPLDVVKDAARDGYLAALQEGVFIPPDEKSTAKKKMAEGVDVVTSLAGLYYKSLAPKIQPVAVEEKYYYDHPDLPLPLLGYIDVRTKDHWVPDIKSAGRKWNQDKADKSLQATMYDGLVRAETGKSPRITFEVFTTTKKPIHQSLKTIRRPEDFDLLVQRAKIIIRSIMAGLFPPAEPGHWCCSYRWCGYYWTCPHVPAYRKILPKKEAS